MKKVLIIFLVVLFPVLLIAGDYPAYTNAQWYVWSSDKLEDATNALNMINNSVFFPITSHNAKTGESEPDKIKSTKWAEGLRAFTDGSGRGGFLRIPEATLDIINYSRENRTNFYLIYKPITLVYDPAWFTEEVE